MIDPADVERMVKAAFPDAQVSVRDQTGTFDHFEIHVVSNQFAGKSLIEQHRMVQKAVQDAMTNGAIHAVHIKTAAPKN